MAIQESVAVGNGRLDSIETTIGVSPKLQLWTGAMPANCATASSGTKLCEMALPSDWMANAASAAKAKSGTWSGTGLAAGTVGYFRIVDSTGATCHLQGTVTLTGAGGDMTMDNTSIQLSQAVSVNTFQLNDGNQ